MRGCQVHPTPGIDRHSRTLETASSLEDDLPPLHKRKSTAAKRTTSPVPSISPSVQVSLCAGQRPRIIRSQLLKNLPAQQGWSHGPNRLCSANTRNIYFARPKSLLLTFCD